MSENNFDIIIIGSGPAGYVAAIRASQLGFKVACIEKEKTLGGTCLNVGCIPSKALLESSELFAQAKNKFIEHGIAVEPKLDFEKMVLRKEKIVRQLTMGVAGLFKKNKITSLTGNAKIISTNTVSVEGQELKTKYIIIATGSTPTLIPTVPTDHENIIDSTDALSLKEVPQSLLVIGGGYIGLEMGSVYNRLGSKVIVVEALDKIVPMMDKDVGDALFKSLKVQGFDFKLSTKVKKAEKTKNDSVIVTVENAEGKEENIEVKKVLVSVGRKPNTDGLNLDKIGVIKNSKGQIEVNGSFQTSIPNIFAIGDVINGPMLAHKASEEGVTVAEIIAGQKPHVNYLTIPSVIYTHPEVASVGFTEEELKEKNVDYKTYKFPFMANGRSLSLGEKEGFVKLIADKKTDRLLGAHIIAARASDLIAELVLAMEYSASSEDIARTIHAHPTLSEAVKEAALGLGTGAIHL